MARAKKEKAAEQPQEKRNFEQDLQQLEEIVGALEEGGLSLDEALKRFEQGIRLARCCEKALSDAEKKIEILTRNAQGELEAQPFEDGEEAVGEYESGTEDEEEVEDDDEEAELLF